MHAHFINLQVDPLVYVRNEFFDLTFNRFNLHLYLTELGQKD